MMIGTARHRQPASQGIIERLSAASARRIVDPDAEVPGRVGTGQLLPDELLSVAGLKIDLSAGQRTRLAREELAAIVTEGIRFEAVLMAGFGMALAQSSQLTGARVTYALHEMGEETHHSRLFVRLLHQLEATAVSPFDHGVQNDEKTRPTTAAPDDRDRRHDPADHRRSAQRRKCRRRADRDGHDNRADDWVPADPTTRCTLIHTGPSTRKPGQRTNGQLKGWGQIE